MKFLKGLIALTLIFWGYLGTVNGQVDGASIDRYFSNYEIVKFNTQNLHRLALQNNDSFFDYSLSLSEEHEWDLSLHVKDIFTADYIRNVGGVKMKKSEINDLPLVLNGHTQFNNSPVIITINHGFFVGMVQSRSGKIFIEAANRYDASFANDEYIIYNERDVIQNEHTSCASEEFNDKSNQLKLSNLDDRGNVSTRNGECFGVNLAIANDYEMYQSRGSGLANWNASVIANVNGDYSGSFADDIEFQIVETYISTSTGDDIWSSSADASTLLGSFMNTASQVFSSNFDLGELWTGKNLTYNGNSGTVGLAYVGEICSNAPYHILEDFQGSSSSMRNLVSHEIGHNFNLGHVTNSNYIMYGSVSGASAWDPNTSIPAINSYINSLNCLSTCDGGGPPPPGDPPVANFNGEILSGCDPVRVQFYDQSTNDPTSWTWSFQSGQPGFSSQKNPIVEFPGSGNYIVSLTVSNAHGSDDQAYLVTIEADGDSPTASFTYSIAGLMVTFDNNSLNGTDYFWNFGDGFQSTSANPTHAYPGPGQYTVSLTTSNTCGSDTYTTVISLSDEVSAGFGANKINVCAGEQVQFESTSTGNIESYQWEFEGGNPSSSTSANPLIGYITPGSFDVALTVSGGGSSDTEIALGFINVSIEPTVSFTHTVEGLRVDFDNNTIYSTSYLWDFGDGSSSTTPNPSHTYNEPGTYTVTLFSENNCGNDFYEVDISVGNPVSASFEVENQFPCTGSSVTFINTSTGENLNYSWTFEGGSPSTSTDINPQVSYNSVGNFNVILEVSDQNGNVDSHTEFDLIQVNNHPEAEFNFTVNGFDVEFQNLSGSGDTYFWQFGDGNQKYSTNPIHTYEEPGSYEVTLTTSNPCGESSITKIIQVDGPLIADFIISNSNICTGSTIQPLNLSTGNIVGYEWIFEGGNPSVSNDINPFVTYEQPGTYPIQLTVYSENQESDIFLNETAVQVSASATSNFEYIQDGLTFQFENLAENYTQLLWDFGDGNTSTQPNPEHSYASEGDYTVSLLVSNSCSEDIFEVELPVYDKLIANFKASVTNVCPEETFMLEDMSTGNPTEWRWEIEGNQTMLYEIQNPELNLINPGSYNVTLTVKNAEEENSVSKDHYINVLNKTAASYSYEQISSGGQFSFTNTDNFSETVFWDFGDGKTSSLPNPTNTYSSEGIYQVKMISTNQCGSTEFMTEVKFEKELQIGAEIPSASQCQGQEISILDASSDNAREWSWEFPGAVNEFSNSKNPKVLYNTPGTYDVILKVKSLFAEKEIVYENAINITPAAKSDFTYTVKKDTVKFINTSTNSETSQWYFGNLGQSDDINPIFIFPSEGVYEVQLVSSNGCGNDTQTQQVDLETETTFVNFDISNQTYCLGDEIHFIDLSSSDITSWDWEFPGGSPSTSSIKNPVIMYDSYGTYDVKLTVSNGFNERTILLEDYIQIQDTPTADFNFELNGNVISASNASVNNSHLLWETGDGNKFESELIEYRYKKNGQFNLKLTASNSCGQDVTTEEIIVNVYPEAGFSLNVTEGCSPLEVQYADRSSSNTSALTWILEGSNIPVTSEPNPTVLYEKTGSYPVTVIASNEYGSDTFKIKNFIKVYDSPEVNYEYEVYSQRLEIFSNVSNYDSLVWDLGDGSKLRTPDVRHTYLESGVYTIKLYVYNGPCVLEFEETIELLNTGINELDFSDKLLIYPNPASNVLNIKLSPQNNELVYEIVNVLGERVKYDMVPKGQENLSLEIADLFSGQYFIRLRSKDQILANKKFIVIH